MALCDDFIKKDITASCGNIIFSGMAPEGVLMNFDQVTPTYNSSNSNIIEGFVFDPDDSVNPAVNYCKGYSVQQLGKQPFEGTQVEMTEGTYGNRFTSTVVIAVSDNGPSITKNIIDKLSSGRFIFVGQNDYVHNAGDAAANPDITVGDNKYQVYGASKGLRATSIVREAYGDSEGAYIVTLTEEGAGKSGVFYFDTDETTTDTAFGNLTTVVPIQ